MKGKRPRARKPRPRPRKKDEPTFKAIFSTDPSTTPRATVIRDETSAGYKRLQDELAFSRTRVENLERKIKDREFWQARSAKRNREARQSFHVVSVACALLRAMGTGAMLVSNAELAEKARGIVSAIQPSEPEI